MSRKPLDLDKLNKEIDSPRKDQDFSRGLRLVNEATAFDESMFNVIEGDNETIDNDSLPSDKELESMRELYKELDEVKFELIRLKTSSFWKRLIWLFTGIK